MILTLNKIQKDFRDIFETEVYSKNSENLANSIISLCA